MIRRSITATWCACLIAVAAVGGTTARGAAPVRDAQSADDLVMAGKAAFKAGDHAGAYRHFKAAADAAPAHPTALYNAALSARKAGLMVEAGDAYRELLRRDPKDLDVVFGLAEVEKVLGHGDAARALYARFIAEEQRPERAELRARAAAALASIAEAAPPPPVATPTPPTTAVSHAARADAERLFADALAHAKDGRHAAAATTFLAAASKNPERVDALLRAGLSFRRAGDLDRAIGAYGLALAHSRATADERLDGTYGLGETHRLKGNTTEAIELLTRYVDGEKRPAEARFVERAKAAIAELRQQQLAASAPTPTPTSTPTPPATTTAPSPGTPVPFFGDRLIVDALVADADARRSAGDDPGAASRLERARALAPDDPRLAEPAARACDAERLLVRGEASLAKQDGPGARLAFQQALACDPTRAAPLWGLSRASDLVGDRGAGRTHARRYLQARGPDVDPKTARAAFFRSEQP